jgi:hypothetical protein
MRNGRCQLHGGRSPGPPQGSASKLVHGGDSVAEVEKRQQRKTTAKA